LQFNASQDLKQMRRWKSFSPYN